MSLKDRLKINKNKVKDNSSKTFSKKKSFEEEFFDEIIKQNENILVYSEIDIPTYNALNYICSKIENEKRLVGIGSNLLLNPDEIIKFEPDIKNQSKELIKTALSLKPYKIVLQDFDGVEAVDIFKLINAGIKNVITAVNAKMPENALSQMELNLYMNGVQIPQNLMKSLITCFVDKIVCVAKIKDEFVIKKIYNVKIDNKYSYIISEITNEKKTEYTTPKITKKKKEVKIDIINEFPKNNILASRLKKKKIGTK